MSGDQTSWETRFTAVRRTNYSVSYTKCFRKAQHPACAIYNPVRPPLQTVIASHGTSSATAQAHPDVARSISEQWRQDPE